MAAFNPPPPPPPIPRIDLGDPKSVEQLLPTATGVPHSGDLAAHVDAKTRKAIEQGEFVDFVSLLPENATASPNVTVNLCHA